MIVDLGRMEYEEAYKIQREFVRLRKLGEIKDSIILVEHESVFTIGRTGRMENLLVGEETLRARGIKALRVDRAGDITFHGPGQLVAYPVIDLKGRCLDLHRYLRDLEEVMIRFLSRYSVRGRRLFGMTGVWASDGKIGFIGVGASNWITYHGLSVNLNVDLGYFSMINACGLKGVRIASLDGILGKEIDMEEAKAALSASFKEMFEIYENEPRYDNVSALA